MISTALFIWIGIVLDMHPIYFLLTVLYFIFSANRAIISARK